MPTLTRWHQADHGEQRQLGEITRRNRTALMSRRPKIDNALAETMNRQRGLNILPYSTRMHTTFHYRAKRNQTSICAQIPLVGNAFSWLTKRTTPGSTDHKEAVILYTIHENREDITTTPLLYLVKVPRPLFVQFEYEFWACSSTVHLKLASKDGVRYNI